MPVEDDINLDNPDGLTQDDLDVMKRQAEELEDLAEDSEKNAEKIMEARKAMEGMSFKQIDLIKEGPASGGSGVAQSGALSQEVLTEHIIDILENMHKAKEERNKNKSDIEKATEHRAQLEAKIQSGLQQAEGKFNEVLSAGANPLSFAKGKILGLVGKAGIYGIIALMVYRVADTLWQEYLKTFKAGGANDVRKIMEDRDKEMAELDDILQRRAGRVFFTGDVDLKQGPPMMSNTERLRDGVMRYQVLHLGE